MKTQNMVNDIKSLDEQCLSLTKFRNRDLLVLYYPKIGGTIQPSDVAEVYKELRSGKYSKENKIKALDILLHTYGGDPVSGYRLAQVIRDFAKSAVFLIPEYAYSAGTLLCFAGDEIRLGDYAGISPIDITVYDEDSNRDDVQLANVEYFMRFAETARQNIEIMLQALGSKNTTSVESDLLVKLVDQETAIEVGGYFREQELTGYYATALLNNYMFANTKNSKERCDKIVNGLLKSAPSHDYHVDYHLCLELGLEVKEMSTQESDLAKGIITSLETLEHNETICETLEEDSKAPFFRFYPK